MEEGRLNVPAGDMFSPTVPRGRAGIASGASPSFWWLRSEDNISVPVFGELRLNHTQMGFGWDQDTEEWLAAREQLWAIREGLA